MCTYKRVTDEFSAARSASEHRRVSGHAMRLDAHDENALKEWKLKEEIVYGPFQTRRKGQALGINVLAHGEKFCSFDCLYCQCGWTRQFDPIQAREEHYLALDDIETALSERFSELVQTGQLVESLVLSGNGEPTLHPRFEQMVDILVDHRDRFFPNLEIQCLTAGTELSREGVIRGLNKIEKPTIKLDAALEDLCRKINRSLVAFDLSKLEKELKKLDRFYLQTCFFDGKINNIFPEALEAWFHFVERLSPAGVEIYSIDRQTAAKNLSRVSLEKLRSIADELKQRSGVESQVVA